ncbi:MAG: type II toxin-antitoxin system HicB family antitoxin [Devosia sp.]|nr:type II toxin-antitoxin system HicB family antitoxin [Devosia sp.]
MSAAFRITLTPDDNGTFLITCPALPEVTTFGETEVECVRNASAAIEEALAARISAGQDVPIDAQTLTPVTGSRILFASIPALSELKLDLYRAIRAAGITRAELARRLGWNRNSVDRLFQLDHASRLDQIEAAAAALGRRVRAEIVEGA